MRRLVRSTVRDVHGDFETEAQIGEGGCRPLHESSPVVDKLNSTVFDGWKEHSFNINAIFAPFQLAGLKSADRARHPDFPLGSEPPWRNETVLAPVLAAISRWRAVHD